MADGSTRRLYRDASQCSLLCIHNQFAPLPGAGRRLSGQWTFGGSLSLGFRRPRRADALQSSTALPTSQAEPASVAAETRSGVFGLPVLTAPALAAGHLPSARPQAAMSHSRQNPSSTFLRRDNFGHHSAQQVAQGSCSADDRSATSGPTDGGARRSHPYGDSTAACSQGDRSSSSIGARRAGDEAVRLQAVDEPDGSRRREAPTPNADGRAMDDPGSGPAPTARSLRRPTVQPARRPLRWDLVSDHQGKRAQNIGLSVQGSRVTPSDNASAFPRTWGLHPPKTLRAYGLMASRFASADLAQPRS